MKNVSKKLSAENQITFMKQFQKQFQQILTSNCTSDHGS